MEKWENKLEIEKLLGRFTIQFSKLEYGLVILCALTESDIINYQNYIEKYLKLSFGEKRDHLKVYIKNNLSPIYPSWKSINAEIGKVNELRRYLVHGIGYSNLFHPEFKTMVAKSSKIDCKSFNKSDLLKIIGQVIEINTGANGICGNFKTQFTSQRIRFHNLTCDQDEKITYMNNDLSVGV